MESTTNNQQPSADLRKLSLEDLKQEMERRQKAQEESRDTYKALVQETLPKAIYKLSHVSEQLSNAKTEIFKYFESILEIKKDIYGIKEKQQTHTFSTEREEITLGYRVNDGWDDTVNTGIAKVNEYIQSLSKDKETAALVAMIFSLLKKDAKGNLKGNRVLELQKLAKDINNEEFTDGVKIIANAYKPVRSVWFIDASLIKEDGSKVSIPLNISAVDFAEGYKFEYYHETE